jgi:hypothetical protein
MKEIVDSSEKNTGFPFVAPNFETVSTSDTEIQLTTQEKEQPQSPVLFSHDLSSSSLESSSTVEYRSPDPKSTEISSFPSYLLSSNSFESDSLTTPESRSPTQQYMQRIKTKTPQEKKGTWPSVRKLANTPENKSKMLQMYSEIEDSWDLLFSMNKVIDLDYYLLLFNPEKLCLARWKNFKIETHRSNGYCGKSLLCL